MPFNPKQPYATITGHPWARYEQNGMLYDYEGKHLGQEEIEDEANEPDEIEVQPVDPLSRDFEVEHAKEFLKNILSGGQLTKSAVYRECTANNQDWEKVQTAFAQMGGQKIKSGNWTYWKLKAE